MLLETAMIPSYQRRAGVLLPAFTPRRDGDLGIGDTRALREWVDWAAEHRVGFLQLLPIQETGDDDSPYNAISSVALEPAYLSCEPDDLPGVTVVEVAAARAGLGAAAAGRWVDYRAVRGAKNRLLETAWRRFPQAPAGLHAEFDAFCRAEFDWLVDYSRFRWLMERNGGRETWDLWPEDSNEPERALETLAQERALDPARFDDRIGFFKWVQWLCFRQWRALRAYAGEKGVKLMGDIPIGVSWYSADVFFNRREFDLDWCGGAPPERMFKHDRFIRKWGQNWGIPLYRWELMKQNDFQWWRQRVGKLVEIFHVFRIDHVLGFYRIYAFPWRPQQNAEFLDLTEKEAAAKTGGRLPGWAWRADDTPEHRAANRADGDLRLKVILEAAQGGEVVGEDLGCVPEYVRPHLASLGIAGFRIPHWDADEDGHVIPPEELPECSFATYATHDHDTLMAMWCDLVHETEDLMAEPDDREKAANYLRLLCEFAGLLGKNGKWPPGSPELRWRLVDRLFASNSRLAAVMVTDVFGMTERFNRPGTVGGNNWRLRLPWTVGEIRANPELAGECERLARSIAAGDR